MHDLPPLLPDLQYGLGLDETPLCDCLNVVTLIDILVFLLGVAEDSQNLFIILLEATPQTDVAVRLHPLG